VTLYKKNKLTLMSYVLQGHVTKDVAVTFNILFVSATKTTPGVTHSNVEGSYIVTVSFIQGTLSILNLFCHGDSLYVDS